MSAEDYWRVMTRATETIRKHTPDRTIIVDGLSVGNKVVENMIPTGVARGVHAYTPAGISQYHASWLDKNLSFPTPTWPLLNTDRSVKCDRAMLEARYASWAELARKAIGVHCGEVNVPQEATYRRRFLDSRWSSGFIGRAAVNRSRERGQCELSMPQAKPASTGSSSATPVC